MLDPDTPAFSLDPSLGSSGLEVRHGFRVQHTAGGRYRTDPVRCSSPFPVTPRLLSRFVLKSVSQVIPHHTNV